MRLCVLISDDSWRDSAGVRIRYDRIAPMLEARGHRLDLRTIDAAAGRDIARDGDVVVFSKTHDARSLILAARLRAAGIRVGIDCFDDYYSQGGDSRFTHLRRWFREIAPDLDFALCATPAMQARLADLCPGVPCHVMNDPGPAVAAAGVAERTDRRADAARRDRHLHIGWFGTGDNPHFSVGLEDLQGHAAHLDPLRARGYTADIAVLTNPRALTTDRLEMLGRLPFPLRLEAWSLEAEAALLRRSTLIFLPVNGQGFSTVKSLNRAVTALAAGTQTLTVGHDLYASLGDFLYRDLSAYLDDLEAGQLKLRPATLPALAARLADQAAAGTEADRLVRFLEEQFFERQSVEGQSVENQSLKRQFPTEQSLNGRSLEGSGRVADPATLPLDLASDLASALASPLPSSALRVVVFGASVPAEVRRDLMSMDCLTAALPGVAGEADIVLMPQGDRDGIPDGTADGMADGRPDGTADGTGVRVDLSARAHDRLRAQAPDLAARGRRQASGRVWLDLDGIAGPGAAFPPFSARAPLAVRLVAWRAGLRMMSAVVTGLFAQARITLAEQAPAYVGAAMLEPAPRHPASRHPASRHPASRHPASEGAGHGA